MDFDFTNETDFALPPEGKQAVRVEKISEKESRNGDPMVVFEFRAENGGKLFHNCMNVEGKRWMLRKTIHAITGERPPKDNFYFDEAAAIGKVLTVVVKYEPYNGKESAKVAEICVPDDGVPGSDTL